MDRTEARNQAIGWLLGLVDREELSQQAEGAERAGRPEIAAQLRSWLPLANRTVWKGVPSVGLPLYRCVGVCGHVATGEVEMAAHAEECHGVRS